MLFLLAFSEFYMYLHHKSFAVNEETDCKLSTTACAFFYNLPRSWGIDTARNSFLYSVLPENISPDFRTPLKLIELNAKIMQFFEGCKFGTLGDFWFQQSKSFENFRLGPQEE